MCETWYAAVYSVSEGLKFTLDCRTVLFYHLQMEICAILWSFLSQIVQLFMTLYQRKSSIQAFSVH
jgi:hypothetical protein